MVDKNRVPLNGVDGQIGWVVADEQPQDGQYAIVRIDKGAAVRIPLDILTRKPDGSYYMAIRRDQFRAPVQGETMMVIPVLQEEIQVSKRTETRGQVNIEKHVHEQDETVEIPVSREEVQVKRVAINQIVDFPPQVRTEGDTTIIPVLEEQLVVEKRLVLKEEIRVTRVQHQVSESRTVKLRKESVDIKRTKSGEQEERDH